MKKSFLTMLWAMVTGGMLSAAAVTPALPEEPVFPQTPAVFKVTDYGAVGDGITDDTNAVQAAIDACSQADNGGTVLLTPGTFLTKMITLRSNMTFEIGEGATIKCTEVMDDFPPCVIDSKNSNWGDEPSWARAFIYAYQAENLRITGPGTINGNGYSPNYAWGKHELERPIPIYLVQCSKVLLDNFKLDAGAMWNIVPMETDDFTMRNVSIDANIVANRDGIDIVDCHRVLVEKCTFYTDDDCICPKSGHERGVEDVTVRDCDLTISGRANGIKFGTKSYGCFRRMLFHDIRMNNIKLAGMAVEAVDGAAIEDIEFRDITMENVGAPVFVILGDRGQSMWGKPRRIGSIKNILFKNISATGTRMDLGCIISGTQKNGVTYAVENLTFDNLQMEFPGGQTTVPGHPSEYDGRYPESNMWGYTPACGFFIRHARNVVFKNCDFIVTPTDKRPFFVTSDAGVTEENVTVTEIKKENVAHAHTFTGSDPELSSANTHWLWDGDTSEGIGFNTENGYIEYDLSTHYHTPVTLSGAAIWQDGSGAHVDRWKVQTRISPDDTWQDACQLQECTSAGWQYADFTAQATQVRVFIECDEYADMFGTHQGKANLHELAVYSADAEPLDGPGFNIGTGTSTDPYIIENAQQLDNMRNYPSSHFRLASDIDLSDWLTSTNASQGWEPIGDGAQAFAGSLDGAGHTICNIWADRSSDNVGLFGLTRDAVITDLAVNIAPDRQMKGTNNVAAFIGKGSATIKRCVATGKITATAKNAAAFIANCPSDVNGTPTSVTTVKQCYAAADISSTDAAGGLIGVIEIKEGMTDEVSESYITGRINGAGGTSGGIVASAVDNRTPLLNSKIVNIHRCFALIESASGSWSCNRIIGYVKDRQSYQVWTGLHQNHALESMTVNGKQSSGTHSSQHGADILPDALVSAETFSNPETTAWDYYDTWTQGTGSYPLPLLQSVARTGQPSGLPDYLKAIAGIASPFTVSADNEFSVTPNPTRGHVSFIKNHETDKVTIFNINGAIVHTTTATEADLSHLSSGLYIARCGICSQKLLKY